MPSNLAIDDKLLLEAQKIGKQTTKKATVTQALKEYIARRKRLRALDAFGTLDVDSNFNYKKDRKRT